jgi:hypothetical protein
MSDGGAGETVAGEASSRSELSLALVIGSEPGSTNCARLPGGVVARVVGTDRAFSLDMA